jgi:hypothetical protein
MNITRVSPYTLQFQFLGISEVYEIPQDQRTAPILEVIKQHVHTLREKYHIGGNVHTLCLAAPAPAYAEAGKIKRNQDVWKGMRQIEIELMAVAIEIDKACEQAFGKERMV